MSVSIKVDGVAVAGDSTISQEMKDYADQRGGVIVDDATGAQLYPEVTP